MTYTLDNKRIFVAGHNGMVGQAVMRRLSQENCTPLTAPRSDLDLTDPAAVNEWFQDHKPEAVILCAAKVGGIHANATYPAEFIYANLMIEANIIHAAYQAGVEKLLFLGSSCIYPRDCPQTIQ
jgi:GDP-L-fucose synthase